MDYHTPASQNNRVDSHAAYKKPKNLPDRSCVFVFFFERIFLQTAISPLRNCLPISARPWTETFTPCTLRFEGDRLWVS